MLATNFNGKIKREIMEGQPETAVSLDELTLDISAEAASEGGIVTEFTDIYNEVEIIDNEIQEREVGKQAELSSNHLDLLSRETEDVNEEISSEDDFEADVPPLSLFPKREDDDEEFEFEIPDVNSEQKTANERKGKTVQFSTVSNEGVQEKIVIDSERRENLDPEIFTPRDKVTSELAASTHSTTVSEESSQNNELAGLENKSPEEALENNNEKESLSAIDVGSERSRPSIVTTAEDWEQVQVVVPGFADEKTSKSGAAPMIESKPLAKFSDTWNEMSTLNYDQVKGKIKTSVDRRGFSAFTHYLFGPPKLNKDLIPERDLIFCLAGTPFDNNLDVHSRILQTIYRCLTGSKFDCQRYGSHWEEIGFQGQDPSTDLRGAGILSLLNILYILQDPSTKELARDIYKLSLHPTQNFPFCVMSINITVQCLKVVRDDIYNREFNRRKEVVGTINLLYAALFLRMYQLWKKGKTIHDSGYVLEEVANYSRKNSKTIFKDLESYEKNGKEQNLFGDQPSEAAFFNVCKQDKCDDKITAELY